MNNLIHEYLKNLTESELLQFLTAADTTFTYMTQVRYGRKNIGPAFALRLEKASGGKLKAQEICPDFDWVAAASGRCPTCDD